MELTTLAEKPFLKLGGRTLSEADALSCAQIAVSQAKVALDEASLTFSGARNAWLAALAKGDADHGPVAEAEKLVVATKVALNTAINQQSEIRKAFQNFRVRASMAGVSSSVSEILANHKIPV